MTGAALRSWQARMGFSYSRAFTELGVSSSTFASLLKSEKLDLRTALACAAIEAGIKPISDENNGAENAAL